MTAQFDLDLDNATNPGRTRTMTSTATKITGLTGLNVDAVRRVLVELERDGNGRGVVHVAGRYLPAEDRYQDHPVLVPLPAWHADVELGKTTATFPVGAGAALVAVNEILHRLPGRGHPRASLHAVIRKLQKALAAELEAARP